jgi:hypothetical protein
VPNFNAEGKVYRRQAQPITGHARPDPVVHTGTIAECVRWVMAQSNDNDRKTCYMPVPRQAGFKKDELRYPDIEAFYRGADFPKG